MRLRLVRRFLVRLFRIGDLKLFGNLSQRRDKLDVDLPSLAERIDLAIGSQFPFHLAVRELEVVRLDRADRAEALFRMRAVDHLAAKDAAIFMERDDQRAAELARRQR